MINITIDSKLKETYSSIRLGCLTFDCDVKPSDDFFWKYMNEEVLPKVREDIEGKEWNEIPGVRGSRLAYKAFGRNPGRYRVSSESLLRRVRREDELYHINSVVDVNNLVSVTSGLSVGSYDISKIEGDVILRKAEQGEGYEGIGKEFLDMENMLVLADAKGVFGSSMSDSTRAMVTEDAHKILVVIYCFEDDVDLNSLLDTSRKAFETYAGAVNIESEIV
ncbi:MAG: hypothetical protein IJ757_07275 [Clostridiales bacterium]|nr:hypothetical protein [Clostridiales bacterium]